MISAIRPVAPQTHAQTRFSGNDDRRYTELATNPTTHGTHEYEGSWREKADPHLLAVIRREVPSGSPVLELGCANGNNLLAVARMGYDTYGLDLEQAAIKTLEGKAAGIQTQKGKQVRCQPAVWDVAESGTLPPAWSNLQGKFKAVYAVHMLGHLSPQKLISTVQALKAQMAPGGLFIGTILEPQSGTRPEDLVENMQRGRVEHSQATLDKAFTGMSLVKKYSRPFLSSESVYRGIPVDEVRWVVYQKPKTFSLGGLKNLITGS
jgi:2-polyprenyl-3-methyl-5-hydroxy-6-metoxy-1,4-benzoquinol methylase